MDRLTIKSLNRFAPRIHAQWPVRETDDTGSRRPFVRQGGDSQKVNERATRSLDLLVDLFQFTTRFMQSRNNKHIVLSIIIIKI